jgi:F-type H+-transporting ATPase subunit epsilon
MPDKLAFELVSPERLLLSSEADMVTVPGTEGEFGVLVGHAPVLSTLRPGIVVVEDGGRVTRRFYVRGGFAEVTPAGLTVLSEDATDLAEIDRDALQQDIRNAEEDATGARDEAARATAAQRLVDLRAVEAAL